MFTGNNAPFLCIAIFVALQTPAFSQHRNLFYYVSPFFATKAVAILRENGTGPIVGVVEMTQNRLYTPVTVTGWLRGLTDGEHGFHVHQYGDLTDGCKSAGLHFNPTVFTHGAMTDTIRHVGDLGNIQATENSRTSISMSDNVLTLHGRNNVLGRTLIVHAHRDDLGRGGNEESLISGNAGPRIACGVIGLAEETSRVMKK